MKQSNAALYAVLVGGLVLTVVAGAYFQLSGAHSTSPSQDVAGRTASD